jgi:hypothetical protein
MTGPVKIWVVTALVNTLYHENVAFTGVFSYFGETGSAVGDWRGKYED